jgi:hypothetical protein
MLAPDGGSAEGFVGAAAGVAALRQNYVNLKGAVDSGQVTITPDAAANAAKACRDQATEFVKLSLRAQQLARKVAMGDCSEGNSLSDTFMKKAQGGDSSAYDLLVQAKEIMLNMASTYEAAGKMYHDTDQGNAQAFKGKM